MSHLAGPLQRRIIEQARENEERSTEAKRFPVLIQQAAPFLCLHNDGRVRDERHRAVSHREVLRSDGASRRKLR